MGKAGVLLTELKSGWNLSGASAVAPSESIEGRDPVSIAQRTLAFAGEHSLDPRQVVIAVASESVLFASIPASDTAHIKSNQSLRFALESLLPVDAESIVADTVGPSGNAAVAMEVGHLQAIVASLEQLQCKVQFIVPESILSLEQVLIEKRLPTPSVSLWMVHESDDKPKVEILVLSSDKSVLAWQVVDLESKSLEQNLLLHNRESHELYLLGEAGELTHFKSLVRCESGSLEIAKCIEVAACIEIDRACLVRKRASALLVGRDTPWMDLRRDGLAVFDRWRRHRVSIARLVFATCFFVATLCGTLLWRSSQYQTDAKLYNQQQRDLFLRAFPQQRVPAAILARLKSEHAKALGIRKTDTKTVMPRSAFAILKSIVGSLSEEFAFEVEEIRIENGRIAMEVKLLTQQDAGKLAAALSGQGFQVEPPATTLVDGDRIMASVVATWNESVAAGSAESKELR
jgi:type II secretory pathway component PulL